MISVNLSVAGDQNYSSMVVPSVFPRRSMMKSFGKGTSLLAVVVVVLSLAGCASLSVQEQRIKFGTENSPAILGTIRFSEQFKYRILSDRFTVVEEIPVEIPQDMVVQAADDIRRIYAETSGFSFVEHNLEVQEKIDKAIESKHTKDGFTAAGNVLKSLTGNKDKIKELANEYTYGKNYLPHAHEDGLFNIVPAGFRAFDPEEDLQKSIMNKTNTKAVISYGISYEVENKKSELGIATRLIVHTAVTVTTKKDTRTMKTISRSDWVPYADFIEQPDKLIAQTADLFRDCVTYDAENMYDRFTK